jgi:hypothetical protein
MIRILVESIFLFLLPTFLYLAWVAFSEDEWPGWPVLAREAPLLPLFAAGAALMLATLIFFSSGSYNSPEDVYVPPSIENGKIEPGHSVHESSPKLAIP